jgi:hypothetical protein
VLDKHGNHVAATVALASCARALAEFGRFDEAGDIATDAYDRAVRVGDAFSIATAGLVLAYVAVVRGDAEAAERIAAAAHEASFSQRRQIASIDDFRGWCAQMRGDVDTAERLHRNALAVFEDFGDTRSRSVVTMHLAEVALRRGDRAKVVTEGVASATFALDCYSPAGAANALLFVAHAIADQGPLVTARIVGCLRRLTTSDELPLSDDESTWLDEAAALARAQLDDSSYERALAEGAATSVEVLVSEVRAAIAQQVRSAA